MENSSMLNISSTNYFNLPLHVPQQRGMYEKNLRYQKEPKAKTYLRSIDRKD